MLGTVLTASHVELDLLWTGVGGGTLPMRSIACARPPHERVVRRLWPYLVMVLVGFLPNEIWRVLGLVLARGIERIREIVVWSRAVATAILAGVIAKLIVFSSGALADIPLAVRVRRHSAAFPPFLAVKRSVFVGVVVGEAVLLIGGFSSWHSAAIGAAKHR